MVRVDTALHYAFGYAFASVWLQEIPHKNMAFNDESNDEYH